MGEFDFDVDNSAPQQRGAYRAMVRGIQARILASNALYEVYDISISGCSIAAPLHSFTIGTIMEMDFEIKGKTLIRSLKTKVMRHVPSGLVGFCFVEPTRQHETVLDKIILEVQKRQIARRAQGSF